MKFYTTEEAALKLNVSVYTIIRWIKSEELKAQKIGRKWAIPEESVQNFIDAGKDHEND